MTAVMPRAAASTAPSAPDPEWPPMRYWIKATVVVVLTMAGLAAVRSVLDVVLLVVIAVVLAVGMEPVVAWLTERGLRRGVAVAILLSATATLFTIVALLIVPPLVRQASGLGADVPTYLSGLEARSDWLGSTMRANHVTEQVRGFIEHLPQMAGRSFGTILGLAGRVGGLVFGVVTVVVLTIYFMVSLPSMRRTATILVRPQHRLQAGRVIDSSVERIGGYVLGNLITSVVCGTASLAALLALGVPFAVPLALWAGLADLVPAIGSYLGAAPAILVAFVDSPLKGLLALGYFIAYQQFENYVLVPRVMRGAVNLSPAAVIIATLVGGSLAGLAGALLALPVAATMKVVIVEVWLRERVAEGDRLAREHVQAETGDTERP
jgi:predicted PurR-regulated permease PerM